jgi:hypothetical protein
MSQPWSVEAIKARILHRLGEVGKTLEDLPPGVRKGFEPGRWQNGPTISTLQTTADILGITVPELLGASDVEKEKNIEPEPNERVMATAFKIAVEILVPADSECPLRPQPELVAKVACIAYTMLVTTARQRPDLAYSGGGEFVLSIIRKIWEARDLEKS